MTYDEASLLDAENAFNAAMISNDPGQIRTCITADWMLVTPELGPVRGDDVLGAIAAGVLGHHTMVKEEHIVRVAGDFGYVTGRGQNTGWFRSEQIDADEWITDIYRRIEGKWLCELTHLTPVTGDRGAV